LFAEDERVTHHPNCLAGFPDEEFIGVHIVGFQAI
jgi:hypothetical protein